MTSNTVPRSGWGFTNSSRKGRRDVWFVRTGRDVSDTSISGNIQDPVTGKIPPRTVDIESDRCRYVIDNLLSYVGPADYEAARRYVPDPENYDLYNILEWERP